MKVVLLIIYTIQNNKYVKQNFFVKMDILFNKIIFAINVQKDVIIVINKEIA
jgi:hypothetical protein